MADYSLQLLTEDFAAANNELTYLKQQYEIEVAEAPDYAWGTPCPCLYTQTKLDVIVGATIGARTVEQFYATPGIRVLMSTSSISYLRAQSRELDNAPDYFGSRLPRSRMRALKKVKACVQRLHNALYATPSTRPPGYSAASGTDSSSQCLIPPAPTSLAASSSSAPELPAVQPTKHQAPKSPSPAATPSSSLAPHTGGGTPKRSFTDTWPAAGSGSLGDASPAAQESRLTGTPQQQVGVPGSAAGLLPVEPGLTAAASGVSGTAAQGAMTAAATAAAAAAAEAAAARGLATGH